MDPFPIGTVKKKDRDEEKFRVFKAESCLFLFITLSAMISLIFNLRMFRSLRLSKSRNFFIIARYYLRKRVIFT
jgi:hypothetical protein